VTSVKAAIIRKRRNNIVAIDFNAKTQTLLGCRGHDNTWELRISRASAYKEPLTRFETNLRRREDSVIIYLYLTNC
jgi:hypothetical protein